MAWSNPLASFQVVSIVSTTGFATLDYSIWPAFSKMILFVLIYMLLFVAFSIILLTQEMDLISSTSAVAATLGNVGPGFNLVGPAMNYSGLSVFTKLLLSFAMILGRLEIYTVLILFTPFFWKD